MNWLPYPYYKLPMPTLVRVPSGGLKPTLDWDISMLISNDLKGYQHADKFLGASPDPQYRTPAAYAQGMIDFAKGLLQSTDAAALTPAGWDPEVVGMDAAAKVFAALQRMPVDGRDPENSNDAFDAWVNGTGQLQGGKVEKAVVGFWAGARNELSSHAG